MICKTILYAGCRLLVLVMMAGLFSCTSASNTPGPAHADPAGQPADTHTASVDQDIVPSEYSQKMAAIRKAVRDAKAAGKSSVDINLDEIAGHGEIAGVVQAGDLVTVTCAGDFDGTPVPVDLGTTLDVVAGTRSDIPGLADAVLGMKINEQKSKTIVPEQAFGKYDPSKIKGFSSVRTMPVTLSMAAQTYKKIYNTFPAKGDLVQITPYFKSRVIDVNDQTITVENLAQNGFSDKTRLGTTTISTDGEKITIRLDPNRGALFEVGGKKGRVAKIEKDRFWVDFNHPLAGKTLHLDIAVKRLVKKSALDGMALDWIEDHEFAIHVAEKRKQNCVLLLYADWCQWCKKMLETTFEDPRIRMLKNDFIWVKINSDEQKEIKQRYHQDGFPLTVLLDDHGNVIKQMSGFKNAEQLSFELKKILNTTHLTE
jgi:FKBP-type peptidyl-prolyl cis-trans isomerase 2